MKASGRAGCHNSIVRFISTLRSKGANPHLYVHSTVRGVPVLESLYRSKLQGSALERTFSNTLCFPFLCIVYLRIRTGAEPTKIGRGANKAARTGVYFVQTGVGTTVGECFVTVGCWWFSEPLKARDKIFMGNGAYRPNSGCRWEWQ